MRKTAVAVVLILLGASLGADAGKKAYSNLKFTVLKSDTGKPIRNASIILHPVDKKGKQERGGMQLKTDSEGRTHVEGIPFGKLRVQVISSGFQTFGEDYDIDQPVEDILIKLDRPKEQHSIYK
ncbi:MAG: carboxypeptidase-like regulatory domain-containing protein [Acidobacteriales bacterium]|nr:carboxypeptidase-like regulatory domain-containing protein [Terriglobales bacterium]